MHELTVYDILNQTQKGNNQTSRLLQALEELAGRLESVSSHGAGGAQPSAAADSSTCRRRGSGRCHQGSTLEWGSLQLPDPQAGLLPLFPGASEFDALQAAATSSSSQLHSRAQRRAWRSWLMSPSHMVLVVEAAWLLLSLVFKHADPRGAALQARVQRQLSQQYVAEVLTGQAAVEDAAGLWAQALADAACHLLKRAFPSVAELADAQLQQVLQRQLRLWTTGLLPSDVGAHSLKGTQQAAAAAADGEEYADDSCAAAAAGTAVTSQDEKGSRRTAAAFVSVKPGPLVSSFMAAQGIKPADVLHATGPQLRSLVVTQQQRLQQQQQQQDLGPKLLAAASQGMVQQQQQQQQQQVPSSSTNGAWVLGSLPGAQQPASDTAAAQKGSRREQAATCLAIASAAAEQYSSSKKAGAAAASRSRSTLQQEMQQLEAQRKQMLFAGTGKVQAASNQIAGRSSELSGAAAALPASVTDARCKAQRQAMQGQLRDGERKLAHAFDSSVHDRCLDMAAAVAMLPPPPASKGPSGSSSSSSGNAGSLNARYDRPGGGWADVAGCSLVSSRLSKVAGGGAAAAAAVGSTAKVTKAAKAIVEDVRRKYAAAPVVSSPPRRR